MLTMHNIIDSLRQTRGKHTWQTTKEPLSYNKLTDCVQWGKIRIYFQR